mmetsp:Transcript_27236/g.71729  ORF Transcript_27236/g.71729 Transcript_27236/m.71729 type:complete len:208 (-) Transcript_27236:1-624(-)
MITIVSISSSPETLGRLDGGAPAPLPPTALPPLGSEQRVGCQRPAPDAGVLGMPRMASSLPVAQEAPPTRGRFSGFISVLASCAARSGPPSRRSNGWPSIACRAAKAFSTQSNLTHSFGGPLPTDALAATKPGKNRQKFSTSRSLAFALNPETWSVLMLPTEIGVGALRGTTSPRKCCSGILSAFADFPIMAVAPAPLPQNSDQKMA